jgi:hypothetical protein
MHEATRACTCYLFSKQVCLLTCAECLAIYNPYIKAGGPISPGFPTNQFINLFSHFLQAQHHSRSINSLQASGTLQAYCVVLYRLSRNLQAPACGCRDREGQPWAPWCQREQNKKPLSGCRVEPVSQSGNGPTQTDLMPYNVQGSLAPRGHKQCKVYNRCIKVEMKTVYLYILNPLDPKDTKSFIGINSHERHWNYSG